MKFKDDLFNAVQSGEIDEEAIIDVDILKGPKGGYGFRSGQWPVTINGIKFSMFESIPHELNLNDQLTQLFLSVKRKIKNAVEGETYLDSFGNERLSFVSRMKRIDN